MSVTGWLKELFLKDLWFKLLALVLALVTWFYIDAELRQRVPPPSSNTPPVSLE